MKQTSRIFIVFFILIISFSACKEDIYTDWKIKNDQWLEKLKSDHANDSTFHVTSTGLCYKVDYAGWSYNPKPNKTSLVKVTYTGKLIDESIFDSTSTRTSAILSLSNVIAGWREGMIKMPVGAEYTFYIPSALGYDTISTNTKIPPHSVLIFDKVKLLDLQNQ